MKKRLLSVILSLCMVSATILSGCGAADTLKEILSQKEASSESTDVKEEKQKKDETKENTETETGTETAEGEPVTDDREYLLNSYGEDLFYVVNGAGEKINTLDLQQIRETVDDPSYPFSASAAVGYEAGILYFSEMVALDDSGQNYGNAIYAYDLAEQKAYTLWKSRGTDQYDYVDYCQIYDGNLYAFVKENEVFHEWCFTKQGDHFEAEKTSSGDFFSKYADEGCDLFPMNSMHSSGCLTETLDTLGFVILYDSESENYLRVSADDSVKSLKGMPDRIVTMYHYDEDGILFYDYGTYMEEETGSGLYYYDVKNDNLNYLTDLYGYGTNDNILFYDQEEALVYLVKNMGVEYGHDEKTIFTLDPKTGNVNILFTLTDVPGALYANDLQGSTIVRIGDQMYTPAILEKELMWTRVEPAGYHGEDTEYVDIDCPLERVEVLDYGTVDYQTVQMACPNCGVILSKYYGECFQLDGKFSGAADKINASLRAYADGEYAINATEIDGENLSEEDCEYHLDFPEQYCETIDSQISSITILRDRILLVNKSSYWYGGGAHGMPGMGQLIFDLDTGEELTFRDLYTGTEEDFKILCAEKTREDLLAHSEYTSPYYEYDAEKVYNDAYEYAGLDYSQVLFGEDGVYLIYQPYAMGAFASGFIEVKLFDESFYAEAGY